MPFRYLLTPTVMKDQAPDREQQPPDNIAVRKQVGEVLSQPEKKEVPSDWPPRIYVACLASYNNGELHGRWINCNQAAEDIQAEIGQMLSESPEPDAEEYAIHDTDNLGDLNISEYEDIEKLAELSMLMEEQGDIVLHVVSYCGGIDHLAKTRRKLDEDYQGSWDSLEDWARNYLKSAGWLAKVPVELHCYFDFGKYAHSFEVSGDLFSIEAGGKVHVFWNR